MKEHHRFVILGKPPVKKNSQRIVVNKTTNARFIMPGSKYKKWHAHAVTQLKAQWRDEPHSGFVHVRAHFFLPDLRRVDLSNLLEAPADALEEAGVLENDYWISSWDGSRRLLDRNNPRIELTVITEHPG